MDFQPDADQAAVLDAVRRLLDRQAGPDRARVLGRSAWDGELYEALDGGGYLDIAGGDGGDPLLAELVVEEAAAALAQVNVGARLLVAPRLLHGGAGRDVALAVACSSAPVRFGADAAVVFVLDGDRARFLERPPAQRVSSTFGYPFAVLDTAAGTDLGPGSGDVLRRWWQVSLAAELAGTAGAALAMTARYLAGRQQFGRPLGALQAVQHRLAEALVSAEGARWLARRAAWAGAPTEEAGLAAGYAADMGRLVAAETHQLSGAIGFTAEYDLHRWTQRLQALRLELGGARSHYLDAADARWPAQVASRP